NGGGGAVEHAAGSVGREERTGHRYHPRHDGCDGENTRSPGSNLAASTLGHHFLEAIGRLQRAGGRLQVPANAFLGIHALSSSFWRRSAIARWRRLLAVPTGISRVSAMSS